MAQRSVGPNCRRIGEASPPESVTETMARFRNRRERRLGRHSRRASQTLKRRECLGQTVVSEAIDVGVLHETTQDGTQSERLSCSDALIKPAAPCEPLVREFRRWTHANKGRRLYSPTWLRLLERT